MKAVRLFHSVCANVVPAHGTTEI